MNLRGQGLRRRRLLGGGLLAALSGVLVAGLWQPFALVSGADGCMKMDPFQSWVGLQLHVVAFNDRCQIGELTQGLAYQPLVTISLVISASAMLAGFAIVLAALGGGLILRRGLRMVRRWWQRRVVPVWSPLLVIDRRVPIRVEVRSVHPGSRRRSISRRGPPTSCC